MFRQAHIL